MVYVLYACGILTGKEREPERHEVTFVLGFERFSIVQLLRKLYWLFTDNWNWSEIDIGTSSFNILRINNSVSVNRN